MAMVGFAPPAPRPEMMRAGALSAFAVNTGAFCAWTRAVAGAGVALDRQLHGDVVGCIWVPFMFQ